MAGVNSVELLGGVTRADLREVGQNGATVQSFTVAVKSAEYDRETRSDVVVQTFIPCERFLPDDYTEHDLLYKGDGVFCLGEITQQKGSDGKDHTRVRVHLVNVTRRGREFAQRTGNMPARTRSAGPAAGPVTPVADDPWAVR